MTSYDAARPLLGVEEEYLVVDPVTRKVVPQAARVVRCAAAPLGERVGTEITRFPYGSLARCHACPTHRHWLRQAVPPRPPCEVFTPTSCIGPRMEAAAALTFSDLARWAENG